MSRNAIVYASRNRMTGTLCQTIDTMHKDSPLKFDAKRGRYAARCVEHNATVYFTEHYPAGRAIAHVDEWCKKCITMLAKGNRVANVRAMRHGQEESKKPVSLDGRMRELSGNAPHDKKWRNGPVKRNAKKETQRRAELVGPMHDIVKRSLDDADAIAESIEANEPIEAPILMTDSDI